MRLIDADKIAFCDKCYEDCPGEEGCKFYDIINNLPTIEIVHCEECKCAEKCEQIVVFDIGENQIEGRKIGFCSYGERIDNE